MARQLRSLRRGEHSLPITTLAPASSKYATIPNYGVTYLTSGNDYVLDAPGEGVLKRIICVSSSSLATVIRGSTGVTVTFNNNGATQIAFTASSTVDRSVELLGVNSTRWTVLNVHPYTTDSLSPSVATS